MGNFNPSAAFAVEVTCLLTSIVMEAILLFLIIDMEKWNDFTRTVFAIAIIDVLTFLSEFAFKIVWFVLKGGPKVYLLFTDLVFCFLCGSIIASTYMSYGIYSLLKRKVVFKHSVKSKVVLILSVLIPIICYITAVINYNGFVGHGGDDNYANDDKPLKDMRFLTYYVTSQIVLWYTLLLIVINFYCFFLCLYYSNMLTSRFQRSLDTPIIQDRSQIQIAIRTLIGRMKYFPIIQILLFAFFALGNNYYIAFEKMPLLHVIFIFPPACYLALFLRMQPQALDHLKHRLGLRSKPSHILRSTVVAMNMNINININMNINNQIYSDASSDYDSRQDAHFERFEIMEEDELQSIVESENGSSIISRDNSSSVSRDYTGSYDPREGGGLRVYSDAL